MTVRVLAPVKQDPFESVRLTEHTAVMWGIAAGKAKNLFGALIEKAVGLPVVILKKGRPSVVVLQADLYLDLVRDREELLTRRAVEIEREQGYIGDAETAKVIARIKHEAHES